MMPSLPTRAHALWIFVPRKYKLSATFAGSAYHELRAGGAGAAAFAAGAPRPRPEAGGGTMQRRRNVPAQSVPAARLADDTRPSTVVAGCALGKPTPAVMARAALTMSGRAVMSWPPHSSWGEW